VIWGLPVNGSSIRSYGLDSYTLAAQSGTMRLASFFFSKSSRLTFLLFKERGLFLFAQRPLGQRV
jgi:hypothetical protein